VAEEGSSTINKDEYQVLVKKLEQDRKKPKYKLGEGGFKISLMNP